MTFQSIVSFIQNPPTKRWTVSEVRYFPQMHWMRSLSFLLSSWKLPYRRHTGWERRFCDIAITLQLQQLVDGVLEKVSCKIFVWESNGRVYAETAGTARHRVQKGLKRRTEDILCSLRRYNICSDVGTQHSPEMLVGLQNGVDVPLSTVKAVSHVPAPTSTPILLNLRCSFMKVGTTTGNRCLWKWTEMNYKRPLVVWARNLQVVFMSQNTSCATPASSLYLDCGFANDLQVSSNSERTPVLLDYCGSLAFKHVLFLRLSVHGVW